MRTLYLFLPKLYYSFPVQLLLNNFRRNHVLILCWIILFAMITGNFGKYLGIPYLFLDPEYMNKVGFSSFFMMGLLTAGFSMAFHITGYISDGHRFSFIGSLSNPFKKFTINNSIIPAVFLIVYVYQIIGFQINNEFSSQYGLLKNLGGLFTGYATMTALFTLYFRLTNKDIFKYVVCRIDEKIKRNVKVTRASALKKLDIVRKKQERVDYYLDGKLKIKPVEPSSFYDKATILQVFDQNHFNLVVIELFIFAMVLVLGLFKDYPAFQIPAACSFMIFLTIFVMLSGAFSYWFGGWSATTSLILFLILNHMVGEDFFTKKYEAFGLNYNTPPAEYSVNTLHHQVDSAAIEADRQVVITQLNNWRKKFGDAKPKMVFLCTSGGGKRASLWTLNALQTIDSMSHGNLMESSVLITGASGGLIGASYFRELKLREKSGEPIKPFANIHRQKISSDNLNPLIFSLLANDLFVGFTKFEYAGKAYQRDRAFTFEDQLNHITEGLMDRPITAYLQPELDGIVPMVILTPTVVNDGRKIYIASRPVSFMNAELLRMPDYPHQKVSGVDFHRFFKDQDAKDLRFLSALRMSATFPYITPNTTLPTEPPIQIMDAGISDNFGMSDAVRFLYSFNEWVSENTSGVIFISIRDSPKLGAVLARKGQTIIDDMTQPISSVYNNFENFQDITSDLLIGQAHNWMNVPIHRIDIQYQAETYLPILQKMDSIRQTSARASLSWRLTTREKDGIVKNIYSRQNMSEINKLLELLK
ncbi:MAG TPA: patatin-like phospholipase family protein [Cyclobacteriaceae bacterium]|nr:patatin-like phospholipase family protein [Cyclobacteriaceae bacterium]HRF35178.1 patatin-like phospholipase family protein [Cyclobacteriaceae bacterium]